MRLHVPPELILPVKVAITAWHHAREAAANLVSPFVLGEVGRLAEAFPTNRALQRFLARVYPLVHG